MAGYVIILGTWLAIQNLCYALGWPRWTRGNRR